MRYKKGDRVRHPTQDTWGLGEVIEDSSYDDIRVFFVGVGEISLLLKYVQPTKVSGKAAAHPVLDNLIIRKSSTGIKYQSLPQSIQFFLEKFPDGFYGQKFNEEERKYKDKASALAQELLGKEIFSSLLSKEEYTEVIKRALKIVNSTNLIFPNEKMSLTDGLKNLNNQREFATSLFWMLFGEEELEQRFKVFSKVLEEIDAAKWTTATYFLFIFHPDKYMFVKPTVTQHSSELCGYEINYKPKLNWLTYKSVMEFSMYLKSELAELKPRDMIDVQSFMWCIKPGKL